MIVVREPDRYAHTAIAVNCRFLGGYHPCSIPEHLWRRVPVVAIVYGDRWLLYHCRSRSEAVHILKRMKAEHVEAVPCGEH